MWNVFSKVAAAMAAAIALTATGTVASADTGNDEPVFRRLCLFQYSNYNYFGGIEQCFDTVRANVKASLDNRVSSLWNNTWITMCAYQLDNQKGYKLRLPSGSYRKNLAYDEAPDGRSWNDRFSSVGPC